MKQKRTLVKAKDVLEVVRSEKVAIQGGLEKKMELDMNRTKAKEELWTDLLVRTRKMSKYMLSTILSSQNARPLLYGLKHTNCTNSIHCLITKIIGEAILKKYGSTWKRNM